MKQLTFATLVALLLSVCASTGSSARGATVAYYRFEEGTPGSPASSANNAILDSSGNGYHGTAFNGPVYSPSVPFNFVPKSGQPNLESIGFNGTNQRIFVPDYPALHLTHGMTLEASVFVQPLTGSSGVGNILFRGDNIAGYDPWRLTVGLTGGGSSTVGFAVSQTDAIVGIKTATISMNIPNNQWIHIAATLDDATGVMNLFLDGTLKSGMSTTIRPYNDLNGSQEPGIGIGALQTGNGALGPEYFHGLIDEVRISDNALPSNQFLNAPEPCALMALAPMALLLRRRP